MDRPAQQAGRTRGALERRRQPKQVRGKSTVEAILQATADLVRSRGFSEVNTRVIAQRAGVSVGSLYQYFPSYEAILLTWYEQISTMAAQQIRLATIEVLNQPLAEASRISISRLLEIYNTHRTVLIEMPRLVPYIAQITRHTSLECLNRGNMRLYFSQHPEFDFGETEMHIFFIETILNATIHRFVTERPSFLRSDTVIEEICSLINAYLSKHYSTITEISA
jgi:AcrR family transcriptional regulator